MAIQNQFVTSFSELYIRSGAFTDAIGNVSPGLTGAGVAPTDAAVQAWFADSTATPKVVTLTIAGTVVAGEIFTATLGGKPFAVTAVTATATAVAGLLRTAIGADDDFSVGTATAGVITITGATETIGDYTTEFATDSAAATGVYAVVTPFVSGTIQIPLVMEIGTLSNEATIIDVPVFGDEFRGKLRGQLDGGQLDVQLYWAPREATHLAIRQYAEAGTPVSVGIKWKPTADALADATELVVFDSFVSSFGIDTTFDDVAKVSATMVVDGAEHFAPGA